MKKLVVCDFDGTLKPYESEAVSDKVKAKLDALLEKGVEIAVSSGRTYGELISYLPEYADRIWFICNDGACYLKCGRVLYERGIERADLLRLADCAAGSFRIYHGATENYSFGAVPVNYQALFAPRAVTNPYLIRERIFKITSVGERLSLDGSGLRVHWEQGCEEAAQMVNRFANKGTALSDLQTRLMLTKYDTVCIGDAANDLPMMRGAVRSFCIGNRSAILEAACTDHARDVVEALDACLQIL